MTNISMPIATAKWLIKNTGLTFKQIADFCGIHILEVQGIADGEIHKQIKELNPIERNLVAQEEIDACTTDSTLTLQQSKLYIAKTNIKAAKKYLPLARRKDKQNAIVWVLINYPKIDIKKLAKLLSTNKTAIENIKNRIQTADFSPKSPAELNFCSDEDLVDLIESSTQISL